MDNAGKHSEMSKVFAFARCCNICLEQHNFPLYGVKPDSPETTPGLRQSHKQSHDCAVGLRRHTLQLTAF